mgnify:CR=1 FL=1
MWPIMRIHHQQSRYIYEIFYRRKEISRELYEWLLEEKYADANLIAKWKKVRLPRILLSFFLAFLFLFLFSLAFLFLSLFSFLSEICL